MIKPHIQIRGINATIVASQKMVQKDSINIVLGLNACADIIYMESQRLVPVNKGVLKMTGEKVVTGKGIGTQIAIQYGGELAPYAWVVHEDPTKFHTPPTQDHYLSDAIANTKGQCQTLMNRWMRSDVFQGLSSDIPDMATHYVIPTKLKGSRP